MRRGEGAHRTLDSSSCATSTTVAGTVAGTTWKATAALQHISNALFDLKETMPDNSYRTLSASLKRSYDEMLNANNNNNIEIVDDPDLVDYEGPGVATP